MAAKPKTPADAAAHFQAFLCAGILDLCRLVKLPELKDLCPGAPEEKHLAITAGTPPVPAIAELASYLRLLSVGLRPKHEMMYPHRGRLHDLLKRVCSKACTLWDAGELKDVKQLQPGVRTLARFARKRFPMFEYSTDGLEAFGVKSLSRSSQILTEQVAMVHARQIAKRLAKDPNSVPPEVLGASLVASSTSPGIVESLGPGHTVRGLMKLGVRVGLNGKGRGRTSAKNPGQEELRMTLRRTGKVLDDRQ